MDKKARIALASVLATGGVATLLVVVVDDLRFAYSNHDVHIALETAATLVAALTAALFYGRARQSLERTDLLLFVGLTLLATSNLGRLLAPDFDGDNHLAVWLPLAGRIFAAGTLAAAAFARRGRVRSARPPWLYALAGLLLSASAIAVIAGLAGDLSTGIDSSVSPVDAAQAGITGSAAFVATQVTATLLFLTAAVGFALRAQRSGEALLAWLAAGMLLGAFARFHFLLFPTVYSDWIFTGDLLFLASYAVIFTGAIREIIANQRVATNAAVLAERTRIARDLHDGLAQDLAYLSMQAQLMSDDDPRAERVVSVAQHALAQSRGVIANLRISDSGIGDATASIARALAARHDLELTLRIDEALEAREGERDELLRIISEAIANAVRHGHATRLEIELARVRDRGLRLRVVDDGRGFLVEEAGRSGGYGIRGMRERAERLGGRLEVSSRPGIGTTVEVVL